MTSKTFRGRYQVQDGYAGGARPKYVEIHADELEDDMDDAAIIELYEAIIQTDFEEKVTPAAERTDEFLVWAHEQLSARSA